MDSNVTLTYDKLKQMIDDARDTMRCAMSTASSCGCGTIHELFYMCKYHYSLMKSNSYLTMN